MIQCIILKCYSKHPKEIVFFISFKITAKKEVKIEMSYIKNIFWPMKSNKQIYTSNTTSFPLHISFITCKSRKTEPTQYTPVIRLYFLAFISNFPSSKYVTYCCFWCCFASNDIFCNDWNNVHKFLNEICKYMLSFTYNEN